MEKEKRDYWARYEMLLWCEQRMNQLSFEDAMKERETINPLYPLYEKVHCPSLITSSNNQEAAGEINDQIL